MFLFTVPINSDPSPLAEVSVLCPLGWECHGKADVRQEMVFVQLFPTDASSEAEIIKVHLPGKIQSRWDANDPALFSNAHSSEKSCKTVGEIFMCSSFYFTFTIQTRTIKAFAALQSKFILWGQLPKLLCWKMLTRKRVIVRFVIYIIAMASSSTQTGKRSARVTVCYAVLSSLERQGNYRILW